MDNQDKDRGVNLAEALGIIPIEKHEHLQDDDYYESSTVKKGRSNKTCEHCGKPIPIGMPHTVHKFYGDGDYPNYPTHNECVENFKKSLN